MDNRYWHTASPPKTGKIGCGTRTRSRRTTANPYRSGPARLRRRLKRQYAESGGGVGFKLWLKSVAAVGVAA